MELDQCLHLLDAEICRKSNCQEPFKPKFVFTKVQAPGFENVNCSEGTVPRFNVSDDKRGLRCSLLLGLSHPAACCLPGDADAAVCKTTPYADQGNGLEIKRKKKALICQTLTFLFFLPYPNFNLARLKTIWFYSGVSHVFALAQARGQYPVRGRKTDWETIFYHLNWKTDPYLFQVMARSISPDLKPVFLTSFQAVEQGVSNSPPNTSFPALAPTTRDQMYIL